VLVGVPEHVSAVAAELARRRVREIDVGDDEGAGGRARQPGEDAHERRLA
jgi:hypothetical protein